MTTTKLEWTNKFDSASLLELAHDLPTDFDIIYEFSRFASNYLDRNKDEDKKLLENGYPNMLEVMKQKGYLKKVEPPPADWSGLMIRHDAAGAAVLYDNKSCRTLLVFFPDHRVARVGFANGGSGNFNTAGELIIE